MEDLPNGFLNFPKKGEANFESAGEAIRKAQSAAQYGTNQTSFRSSQRRAVQDGWRLHSEDDIGLFRKRERHGAWGADEDFNARDIVQFMDVPDIAAGQLDPTFNTEKLQGIEEKDRRWAWIDINLSAIQNNVMALKGMLDSNTKLLAVVKADGYGHGAVATARTALNSGANYIGVATIDEAIELREADITAPILILSEPPIHTIPMLLAYHVMPSVTTVEFAIKYGEAADTVGCNAPYHLKINTGMNRIGVRFDEVWEFLRTISFHRALDLKGTFTHFATADDPDTMEFRRQVQRFEAAVDNMRRHGIHPGIVHAANSAATIRYPEVHYDMVRVGLAMYGHYPCREAIGRVNLMPAMSIHARITQVNQVPVGEGVSYGLIHRSGGFAKTCTIPIGYADGLRRGLSNRIDFIMQGQLHPQVGNICMDQCMFEVDGRTRSMGRIEPREGDIVTIVGAEGNAVVTIEEMSDILGTIPYELMIGFGTSRLPRIYS